jgi:hypothetical protein
MERTLWYECHPRPFFGPARAKCHREQVGRLEVFEYHRRSKKCPYGLRMEARVHSKEEAAACQGEAFALATSLRTVWPYVAGSALFPRWLTIQVMKAPAGWRTNAQKILSAVPATGPRAELRFGRPSSLSLTMPCMPLRDALSAVRAHLTANESTRLLLELHSEAMALPGSQAGLFLFAKALELARFMLPGRDDKAREAALPLRAREALRQPIHWLYGIANRRLEIRHVLSKDKSSLLPQLSRPERADFLHDADLVIRGVVERELGIRVTIVDRASEKVL